MVEAARHGQLSTVRKLLDRRTATVEDRDNVVSVCVCTTYFLYYFKTATMALCITFLIIHHTLLVCVHVVCMLVLVLTHC